MKSMTGYGFAEKNCEQFTLSVQIKSYNNRYSDIVVNLPQVLNCFEQKIINTVREAVERGRVDVTVLLKKTADNEGLSVNEDVVKAYVLAFSKIHRICEENNLKAEINLTDLINREGVLTGVTEDAEQYEQVLFSALDESLESLKAERIREGLATKNNISKLIDNISANLAIVESCSEELEELIKNNLKTRIKEMLSDSEYDENRILTEVAVMLMRYTINEEINRLQTHISEFKKLLDAETSVGKKLDFISQEMNREINTIGSKSQIVKINLCVVNMKDNLENIREQLRNVE